MIINGKERNFRRTVWATCRITEMCPDEDISNINAVIGEGVSSAKKLEAVAKIIAVLNEADERAKAYETGEKAEAPLTADEVLSLGDADFAKAEEEAMKAYIGDVKQKIETEKTEKKVEALPQK